MAELKYAVYPGTVTLLDGVTQQTWTAEELAEAYGVADEPYVTVTDPLSDIIGGRSYFEYMHLKPRSDGLYEDIKYVAEDDDQDIAYRPDFDGSKRFIQETDPRRIYPDEESEEKLGDDLLANS